jgi:hypothetical protein
MRAEPRPDSTNKVADAYVDRELANEGFTYVLESGAEGSVHLDQILEYNEDPTYLRDLLIYKLTADAARRVEESGLSRRELARRLRTSVPQLYRLLDTTNSKKSLNQYWFPCSRSSIAVWIWSSPTRKLPRSRAEPVEDDQRR